MAQAKLGDTVQVHYTGKFEDGTVFDASSEGNPLEFPLGEGRVIPGFEEAVVGMAPGESKTQTVPCTQAYGPHYSEMVVEVDRQQMPADLDLSVGLQLQLQHPSGRVIPVVITEIEGSKITLDANHPLAGKDLTFEIELVAIVL